MLRLLYNRSAMQKSTWLRTTTSIWLVVLVCAALGEWVVLHAFYPTSVMYRAPQATIRAVLPYIGELEYENDDPHGRAFRWLPNVGDIRLIGGGHTAVIVQLHAHTGRPPQIPVQFQLTQGTHVVLTNSLPPGWRTLHMLVPVPQWSNGYATIRYQVTGDIPDARRPLGLAVDTVQIQSTHLVPQISGAFAYWMALLASIAIIGLRSPRAWWIVIVVSMTAWLIQLLLPGWWWLLMPSLWAGVVWLAVLCSLWGLAPYRRALWSFPVALASTLIALVLVRSEWSWFGAIVLVVVWFGYQPAHSTEWSFPHTRWVTWIVVVASVVGLCLRVTWLENFPMGMFRDEARHGGLAQLINNGVHMIYSPFANLPAGYFYVSALPIQWFGASAFAVRISAALIGSATIPALYWAFRTWWGAYNAAIASVVLSTLLWHVGMSRIGFPASAGPLLTVLAVGMLWRALADVTLRRAWVYACAAGLAAGAMTLVYHSARLMPLVVVGMIVASWYESRWTWRSRAGVLAVWAGCAAAAAFPIVWYAITESYNYMKRIDSTSLSGQAQREGIPFIVAAMRNLLAYLGALLVAGDRNPRHFYMGMPQLNISEGVALLAGIIVLWRQRTAKAVWLGWYAVIAFLPGILSVDAPHALRTVEATIPVVLCVATGMADLLARLHQRWRGYVLIAVLLLTGVWSGYTYYQWQSDERAYEAFDGQLTKAVTYVHHTYATAATHQAQWYLPRVWRDGDVGVYLLRGMMVGQYSDGVLDAPQASTQLVLIPAHALPPAGATALVLPLELQQHNDLALWCVGDCTDTRWLR